MNSLNNYTNPNPKNNQQKKENESRFFNALVYIIVIITVAMIAPLVYKFADEYSNSMISTQKDKEVIKETAPKNRKYTVADNTIDLSGLRNTEFGTLSLVTAKITDDRNIILFCSSRIEIETETEINAGETSGNSPYAPKEYETLLRIASVKNIETINIKDAEDNFGSSGADIETESAGDIQIYSRAVRYNFLESVQDGDYTFKDYGDNTVFISNNKIAFLFDTDRIRVTANYTYPNKYHIYQTALSNDKEMLALATEEGFYVASLNANMGLSASNMKEIIAPVNINGVNRSARYPVWSDSDERIYYRIYADNRVQSAGVTTPSPGGNEQLTALDCNNFLFLNNDSIFYYFLAGTEANPGNMFRCGYFNMGEKKMTDIMKSQVYYFDIDVSSKGTHLAALSYNGNMIKISIIDIRTKKLIYSSLYGEIYDYSFSPDEKNLIIYGKADNKKTLKVINIDWTEE